MPTWPLLPDPEVDEPVDGLVGRGPPRFLGYGLLMPFARDGRNDFVAGGVVDLVRSNVRMILGTRSRAPNATGGDLPWRTDFGSLLHLLRHRPNTVTTQEIARVYVVRALQRWEHRVRVTKVTLSSDGARKLTVRVRYSVVDSTSNAVATDQLVELPLLGEV